NNDRPDPPNMHPVSDDDPTSGAAASSRESRSEEYPEMRKLLASTASALVLAAGIGLAGAAAADTSHTSIVRDPAEVPAPVTRSAPATVKLKLETIERVAELNDGSTYRYWTFDNQVPGPLTRVRV